jgi:phosphoribosylformimino-5-aminoimidazole carboxamide ribotide isomerase
MRVIPVLDLMRGEVVRGVGGRRDEYRAIRSRLVDSARPLDVARAFRAQFDLPRLYIADLDALRGGAPQIGQIEDLAGDGFELLVDAGLCDIERGHALVEAGAARVIAALETSGGPGHLRAAVQELGPERVTFSLDLKAGRLLGDASAWGTAAHSHQPDARVSMLHSSRIRREIGLRECAASALTPEFLANSATPENEAHHQNRANVRDEYCEPEPLEIALRAVECGVRSLIVLDLAGVGEGQGVPTIPLCRQLRAQCGDLEIITGGGVRHAGDLAELATAGVDGVLVASALHDGALSGYDLQRYV